MDAYKRELRNDTIVQLLAERAPRTLRDGERARRRCV
jgi:hypothetical protein